MTYAYTYDGNGNILSISDGSSTTSYVYDSANQFTRENNQAAGKTWVWDYDDAGNILSRTEYAYTAGDLPTNAEATVSYGYNDASWGDLLTSYNGRTISYDTIGNPTSDGVWNYTWEHGRQLAGMSNGSATWSYDYDANGMRTKRTSGSSTYEYFYTGDKLTYMTLNGEEVWFYYDASGTPYAVKFQDAYYYYTTNAQGDVTAILDSSGNKIGTYTYDAWGKPITTTAHHALTIVNPLRYRGYVYDQETELYYLQSRYYNPEVGRFLNPDRYTSTGQGLLGNNMHTYCLNNPVRYKDVSGFTAVDCFDTDGDTVDPDDDATSGGGASNAADSSLPTVSISSPNSPLQHNSYNFNGSKSQQYAENRGWTSAEINRALDGGKTGESTNRANGNNGSVYSHPQANNQYIVIDDKTRSVVQVSNLRDPDWIVDRGIRWLRW